MYGFGLNRGAVVLLLFRLIDKASWRWIVSDCFLAMVGHADLDSASLDDNFTLGQL